MCLRGQRRVLDSLKLVCEPPDMGMRTELRFSARAANTECLSHLSRPS